MPKFSDKRQKSELPGRSFRARCGSWQTLRMVCHSIKGTTAKVRWNHSCRLIRLVLGEHPLNHRQICYRNDSATGLYAIYHSCFPHCRLLVTGVIGISSQVSAEETTGEVFISSRETPTVRAIRRASPSVVNLHGQKTVRTGGWYGRCYRT